MNKGTELAFLVSKAKASVFTLEYISQFETADIDSDDVDLRFEVDGIDTGTNVSIVDECGKAAEMIVALIAALEQAQQREARSVKLVADNDSSWELLFAQYEAANARIADLELRLSQQLSVAANNLDMFRRADARVAELEARPLSVAAADVLAERQRQKESKGYTERRDDNYLPGVLNLAGAAYAVSVSTLPDAKRRAERLWPWPDAGKYLKSSPKEPRAAMVKAGALILAEIERIDRAAGGQVEDN